MAKQILIVDDSATMREALRIALKEAGYEVATAANGQAALAVLATTRAHLIISDVNMPVMNGLEFLAKLREGAHKFVPVVMLTTEGSAALIEQGKQLGARAWMVKPFSPPQLVAVVRKLVLP